jgi:uncharacterized protein (TIGR02302 family)
MSRAAPPPSPPPPIPRLGLRRGLARAAILWERVWPAIAPLLGVLGVFAVIALTGLLPLLPGWLHLIVLAAFLCAACAAIVWGARQIRLPGDAEGERRLERASGLAHRPLASLADRPAGGGTDPAAAALWAAHQARAARAAANLKVGTPHPGLPRRDPMALRAGLALSLLAALVIAGPETGPRLGAAVSPSFGATAAPPLPLRLELWITPPAYTGMAPVFVRHEPGAGTAPITVPTASRLAVHVSGGTGGAPRLDAGGGEVAFRSLDAQSFAAETTLETPGRLAIMRDGRELAAWPLRLLTDAPPTVAFVAPPGRAPATPQLRIEFDARDDYGVVAVDAILRLVARPEAEPLAVPMPVPGGATRHVRGTGQPDLSAHPWAGLPVTITLEARDGADQTGRSETLTVELPERRFEHPVARALVALRKRMTLAPAERSAHTRELDRLAAAPEAFDHDFTVFLGLRVARSRLRFDRTEGAVAEVQELLWELALRIEEGGRDRTWRQLSELREQLREALDRVERGEEVDREELERLAQQLQEAMQRYFEALMEQMRREGVETLPFDRNARTLDMRDMQRMAERMQEAARRGELERMRQQLAELERAIEQLRQGRMSRMESPERQQQREQGQQMMGAVNDMLQRQGQLMDRSHQRAEQDRQQRQPPRSQQQQQWRQPSPGQQQQQQQQRGQQQQQRQRSAEGQMDQRQQQALRRALGELMDQFADMTGDVPEPLGQADLAMREAVEALGQGDNERAQGAQQRAIEALQQGGREMQNQMAGMMGMMEPGEGEGDPGGENTEMGGDTSGEGREMGQGRDPLGRPRRDQVGGRDEGSDVRVPEEMEMQRTREIQEELRRRAGERERPQPELEYIDRLLRRF